MSPPIPEPRREAELSDLFAQQFLSWVARESAGPRPAALEAYWSEALLAPALAVLERPGKQFRAQLVATAWELAGGASGSMPIELALMVEVLHAGSLVVDDVQDQSRQRRGQPTLHRSFGMPLAINTGNLFYCWSLDLLAQCGLPADRELELHRRTVQAMLRCHQGQALDLSVKVHEPQQSTIPSLVQTSTRLKAGALMELSAALGAVGAGADPERALALCEFGRELGTALQMLDDLSGVLNERRRDKGEEDLRLARLTWVWGWLARDLDADRFAELQRMQRRVADGADPSPLREELAHAVRHRGRARVHEHLDAALRAVSDQLGHSARLTALRQEVERLERSYV